VGCKINFFHLGRGRFWFIEFFFYLGFFVLFALVILVFLFGFNKSSP